MMVWCCGLRCILAKIALCLLLCITGNVSCIRDYHNVRPCSGDYKKAGRCFEAFNKRFLDWNSAEEYCRTQLAGNSSLAAIEDATSAQIVTNLLTRGNVHRAWINGALKISNAWYWHGHWKQLAYQGCFVGNNPEFPIEIHNSSNMKPSQCLAECAKYITGPYEDYYVGIQLCDCGKLVCYCGSNFGKKYGRTNNAKCDTPCPSSHGKVWKSLVMDKRCGNVGLQLVYSVRGTKFHAFTETPHSGLDKPGEHCAIFNGFYNHKWTQHSCLDKLPFICDHILSEYTCERKPTHKWVQGACITIHNEAKDFFMAQVYCSSYNADLLMVSTPEIYNAVVPLLDPGRSYFFALTKRWWLFSYWDYIFRYYNWGHNQPSNNTGEQCVSVMEVDHYRWHNIDCAIQLPFVCMVDNANGEPDTSDTKKSPPVLKDKTISSPTFEVSKDLLIGIAVGCCITTVVVLLIISCICCLKRKRNQKRKHLTEHQHTQELQNRKLPPTPPVNCNFEVNPAYPSGNGPKVGKKNPAYINNNFAVNPAYPSGDGPKVGKKNPAYKHHNFAVNPAYPSGNGPKVGKKNPAYKHQ